MADGFHLDGQTPGAVLHPADREEAARILLQASEQGEVCVPWGGGTRQSLGFLPTRYDAAICTDRLSRLIAVEPGDLTVTVEAGMTLSRLQQVLAEHTQFVALESPCPDRETIGGILACGASALIRCGYGSPRDQLIGVTAAMTDGTLVKGGGRVVKNVAGYDLCKLFTGSFGTLGLIVEATFKVRPLSHVRRTWLGSFPGARAVEEAVSALIDSPVQPSVLQAMDPSLRTEPEFAATASAAAGESSWLLAVGCDGDEELSQWMASESSLRTGPTASALLEGEQSERLRDCLTGWSIRHAALSLRVGTLSSRIVGVMDAAGSKIARNQGVACRSMAAAANGIAFLHFDPPAGQDLDGAAANALIGALTALVEEDGGHVVVLGCPASCRAELPMWGEPAATWPLMRRIRNRLDPKHTLNRGRLFQE